MPAKSEVLRSGQRELDLGSPKKKRRIKSAPEGLLVSSVPHAFPTTLELPCATLLSWCDPRFLDSDFYVPISAEAALAVLSVMPPTITAAGSNRALVGLVELTVALLKALPADLKIRVIYIEPDHPFCSANLPIYELLKAKPIELALPTLIHMTVHLAGRRPTDAELSYALGKDRSSVTRARNRIENVA